MAPEGRSGVYRDVSWDLDLRPRTWLSSPWRGSTGGCRDDVPGKNPQTLEIGGSEGRAAVGTWEDQEAGDEAERGGAAWTGYFCRPWGTGRA